MKLKEIFDAKIAVRCPSEEDAVRFVQALKKENVLTWEDHMPIDLHLWHMEREKMTYTVVNNYLRAAHVDYYAIRGYKIYNIKAIDLT